MDTAQQAGEPEGPTTGSPTGDGADRAGFSLPVRELARQLGIEHMDGRAAVTLAAIRSFALRGYYGTTIQSIANEVGMTKAGVLHHVGSKEGLLEMVLDDLYDGQTAQVISHTLSQPRPLIARMWRETVAINARRPLLVHMFSTLTTEALDPDHPAHEYFQARERTIVDTALNIRWSLPKDVDAASLIRAGFSMMDGLQLRWLRAPGQDLEAMWAECEPVLFPLPLWKGYI